MLKLGDRATLYTGYWWCWTSAHREYLEVHLRCYEAGRAEVPWRHTCAGASHERIGMDRIHGHLRWFPKKLLSPISNDVHFEALPPQLGSEEKAPRGPTSPAWSGMLHPWQIIDMLIPKIKTYTHHWDEVKFTWGFIRSTLKSHIISPSWPASGQPRIPAASRDDPLPTRSSFWALIFLAVSGMAQVAYFWSLCTSRSLQNHLEERLLQVWVAKFDYSLQRPARNPISAAKQKDQKRPWKLGQSSPPVVSGISRNIKKLRNSIFYVLDRLGSLF